MITAENQSKHNEYQQFAARLRQALTNASIAADSPTQLQRNFNLRAGAKVTVHGARKWLIGEAIPTQDKLRVLATWLGVQPDWLRFGAGEGAQSAPDAAMAPRTMRILEGFERLIDRDQQLVQAMIDNMLQSGGAA